LVVGIFGILIVIAVALGEYTSQQVSQWLAVAQWVDVLIENDFEQMYPMWSSTQFRMINNH
jgi:hypothetical protein